MLQRKGYLEEVGAVSQVKEVALAGEVATWYLKGVGVGKEGGGSGLRDDMAAGGQHTGFWLVRPRMT